MAEHKGKVILTTFAGRRDRMELLTWYVRAAQQHGLIDEWHVWDFSRTPEDRAWLRQTFPTVRSTPSDGTEYHFSGNTIAAGGAPRSFQFSVSGRNDIHIGLLRESGEGRSFEVALGGWLNTRSVIRSFSETASFHDPARRGAAENKPEVSVDTPGLMPDFGFITVTIELSEAGLTIYAAGVAVMGYPGPIRPGTFKIMYRSGFGCNAEWRFPNWPERGEFLFLSAKPVALRTGNYAVYQQAPFYMPFYQHYAWRQRAYGADLFLKCDDDIVFIDLPGLARLIEFRWRHPEYFLVSANVINNGVCAYFQQRAGLIPRSLMELELPVDGFGGALWQNPKWAESLHYHFLTNLPAFLKAPAYATLWNERLSVNFVSWLGHDLSHMSDIMLDDEEYLCYQARWRSGKPNTILSACVVAHLTFFPQDNGVNIPGVLSAYRGLATQLRLPRPER